MVEEGNVSVNKIKLPTLHIPLTLASCRGIQMAIQILYLPFLVPRAPSHLPVLLTCLKPHCTGYLRPCYVTADRITMA